METSFDYATINNVAHFIITHKSIATWVRECMELNQNLGTPLRYVLEKQYCCTTILRWFDEKIYSEIQKVTGELIHFVYPFSFGVTVSVESHVENDVYVQNHDVL